MIILQLAYKVVYMIIIFFLHKVCNVVNLLKDYPSTYPGQIFFVNKIDLKKNCFEFNIVQLIDFLFT